MSWGTNFVYTNTSGKYEYVLYNTYHKLLLSRLLQLWPLVKNACLGT